MTEFAEWFRQQVGVFPQDCSWLQLFMTTSNPTEALSIFEQHPHIFSADEMFEELEATFYIISSKSDDRNGVLARAVCADRMMLIDDARKLGVREAIKLYQARWAKP